MRIHGYIGVLGVAGKSQTKTRRGKRVLAVAMSSSSGIVKHVSSLAEIASCAASKEAKGVVWDRGEHAHAAAMSNWLAENRGSKMFYAAVRGMSYAQERFVINTERMASASTGGLDSPDTSGTDSNSGSSASASDSDTNSEQEADPGVIMGHGHSHGHGPSQTK